VAPPNFVLTVAAIWWEATFFASKHALIPLNWTTRGRDSSCTDGN
jgi:hypothetical protein